MLGIDTSIQNEACIHVWKQNTPHKSQQIFPLAKNVATWEMDQTHLKCTCKCYCQMDICVQQTLVGGKQQRVQHRLIVQTVTNIRSINSRYVHYADKWNDGRHHKHPAHPSDGNIQKYMLHV